MKTQCGRDLDGSEMAEMLDEFCNGADSRRVHAFIERLTTRVHRTLQQKICGLFVKCIESWAERAESPGLYDARNEATVLLCKKIIAATGDKYDRALPCI